MAASSGSSSRPQWNGREFVVADDDRRGVLCYDSADSNWSPELTALHEAEAGANHPIDQASRALAIQSIQQFAGPDPVVLDVGSSSGFVLDELQRTGSPLALIGSDFLSQPLLALARRLPGVPLLQFDLSRCPLPDACVDAVIALNVLEHIADHEAAVREIFRSLKPGGIAHIEVPAGPHLFDIYDEHLMHHRRYTMPQLRELATRTGFEILRATHLGAWMYPAFAWVKRRNRRFLSSSAEEKSRIVASEIRSTSHSVLLRTLLPMIIHVVITLAAGYSVGSEFRRRDARAWLESAGGDPGCARELGIVVGELSFDAGLFHGERQHEGPYALSREHGQVPAGRQVNTAASLAYLILCIAFASALSLRLLSAQERGDRVPTFLAFTTILGTAFFGGFYVLGFLELATARPLVSPVAAVIVAVLAMAAVAVQMRRAGTPQDSGARPVVASCDPPIGRLAFVLLTATIVVLGGVALMLTGAFPIGYEARGYHLPIALHIFQASSLKVWDPAFPLTMAANASIYYGVLLGAIPERLVSAADMLFLLVLGVAIYGLGRLTAPTKRAA